MEKIVRQYRLHLIYLFFQMKTNVNIDPATYSRTVQILWAVSLVRVSQDTRETVFIAKVGHITRLNLAYVTNHAIL